MGGEGKNINKRISSGTILSFHLMTSVFLLPLFFSACSSFSPELFSSANERARIIEDVLKRGRIFSVRPDDEAALQEFLDDPDPDMRMTVLKIMEKNPSESNYDGILRVTQDEEEVVSEEAYRILLEQWESSRKAVIRGLNARSASLLLSSINCISRKEAVDEASYLLTLFSDSRSVIRSAASRTYAKLGSYEYIWFQSMLTHEKYIPRLTAVQTLPRFRNPELIPAIIPYIRDPEQEIRTAALFGLSEFDVKALPYLHETLRFSENDELRLGVLQIVEGILDPSSAPVLIRLMGDENGKIASKSVEILARMGKDDVIPLLIDQMVNMARPALKRAFMLSEKYKDERLLPILSGFVDHDDQDIAALVVEILRSYGKNASDYLIAQMKSGNPLRATAMKLLVEMREPHMVFNEEYGGYRTDNILYIFETLSEEELLNYLSDTALPSRIVTSLWNLYDIETNAALYRRTRGSAGQISFPYFTYFRQWEEYRLNAETSRSGSFEYLQDYFDMGEEHWLRESRILRDTAEWYEKGAVRAYHKAVNAGTFVTDEDLTLYREYIESRRSLVSRWRVMTSDIQELALLVFLRYSLDIETMAQEYDFFRSLPERDIPSPDKF